MKHDFDSTIIRAYDIRGVFNQTLNTDDARVIGHLIGINLRGNRIVNVGYDGRHSSVFLKNALIEGLIESNAIVNEIELGPTPMLYYSCYINNAEFGIMIRSCSKCKSTLNHIFNIYVSKLGTVTFQNCRILSTETKTKKELSLTNYF